MSVALAVPTIARAQEAPARVVLELTSPQRSLTFYQVVGGESDGGSYERLCTAPCRAPLSVGDHIFALSLGGEPAIAGAVRITAPTRLVGVVSEDRFARELGWTTFAASLVLGAVPATTAAYMLEAPAIDGALLGVTITGAIVCVALAVIGLVLGTSSGRDATIRLE